MKYQQLENLESGWKWKYLVKKHREGELITRYIEASAAQEAVDVLLSLENEPVLVNGWIDKHMNCLLYTSREAARYTGEQETLPLSPQWILRQCKEVASLCLSLIHIY